MSYKINKKNITEYDCKCEKCGWTWSSLKLPNACSKCKQSGWDIPPKDKKKI
jgi:predicted Zn-ribbon and HTH transcriptional regulator|tara:strand:+ start:362 stop:517 length:156 start_codon:yes stop_codon:yes gene_type:complete